jgi:hypothetical protein
MPDSAFADGFCRTRQERFASLRDLGIQNAVKTREELCQ